MKKKPELSSAQALKKKQLMELILAVRFSDLEQDQQACKELLSLCEQEGDSYGMAFAYAYLGDCLIGKNDGVNASTNLLRAKELCEKHRFLDLLPNVCNWLGIYYEMQNDRQMAMRHFLDALEFAERSQDLFRQSLLLNNIASQFQASGNLQVAKEYYLKAFERYNMLNISDNSNPHYAQMTANIISVCCQLGEIDEAKNYYSLLEKSGPLMENKNQLYLCELLIAATVGDIPATHASVDKLLLEMEHQPQNLQQFFETFLIVAESMISLKQIEYARKLLNILNDLCPPEEYGHQLKVQYVWILFFKQFGTEEEKRTGYERFYELRKLSDATLNKNLADGLLSNIKLRESVKKNEEIERARVKLEDEVQIDELTRIYNRRYFREITEQAATDSNIHTLSIIMIDVDYFKQYNDTYGHAQGDNVLRAVASSMQTASNENIFCFRYGGDEFIAVCKNMESADVEQYIQNFSELLHKKQISHCASLCSNQLTLSIGYSTQHRKPDLPFDILSIKEEADKALYYSKDLGRNCYSKYSSSNNSKLMNT